MVFYDFLDKDDADCEFQHNFYKRGREMRETLLALVHIAILGFCAWLFDVELQTMLLFSIAFNLITIRMKMEERDES